MKRKLFFLLLIIISLSACKKGKSKVTENPKLLIYATENKSSELFWQNYSQQFTDLFDCDIEWKIFTEPEALYSDLKSKTDSLNCEVDLVLGLDNLTIKQANLDSIFTSVKLSNEVKLLRDFEIYEEHFVPFAYSPIGFIYNVNIHSEYPKTFGELQDGMYYNRIIVPNPKDTSIGANYLVFTVEAFGRNAYGHFWRSLKDNIYETPDSFDLAVDKFLAEMGSILIAPISMENYLNELNENSYGSFIPIEGTTEYIEYGAVLENSKHPELAENFLNYVISDEFQINIFEHKKLFPTNKNIKLNLEMPKNYKTYKLPYSNAQLIKQLPYWKKRWEKLVK